MRQRLFALIISILRIFVMHVKDRKNTSVEIPKPRVTGSSPAYRSMWDGRLPLRQASVGIQGAVQSACPAFAAPDSAAAAATAAGTVSRRRGSKGDGIR